MAESFFVSPSQVKAVTNELDVITAELKKIFLELDNSIEKAQMSWKCDTANDFFRELGDLVRNGQTIPDCTAKLKQRIDIAMGNYQTNEQVAQNTLDQILKAYDT